MTKGEVDSHIMPMLAAMEDSEDSEGDGTARKRRAESPLVEAASRRAKNRARAAGVGSATPLVGHQVRGGRFFVAEDGETYISHEV